MIRSTARFPHVLFAALLAGWALYAITGDGAVRNVVQVTAVVAMGAYAVRRSEARVAWLLLTVANATWAIGDFDPFSLNAFYLVSYVFAHAGLVFLVAAQARLRWRASLALDGIVAGLAVAAALTSFVGTAFDGTGVRVPATSLAGDAMIVTTIVLAFALSGWRPARAWWIIAAGETILVALDLMTVSVVVPTPAMLVGWVGSFLLVCYASFHPSTARVREIDGAAAAGVPLAGGAIAVALLMHAALSDGMPITVWLAGAAVAAGLARALLLLADNQRLLRQTRVDATTDKLTGLPNRRALNDDLDAALEGGRDHTLAFFDLDGFKDFNDSFGHAAGDALLQRLASALGGYRLGGDEFCVLLRGALTEDAPEIARAVAALSEQGSGFTITASFGLVVIPHEASTAAEALERADERMYARKRRRRATHARDVLRLLAQGEEGVTQIAAEIGLVTLSGASSAAPGPAGSSGDPAGSARRAERKP